MDRIQKKFDWWCSAEDEVKNVVVMMCYQLGIRGFSGFRKTIEHLENKRYGKAAAEMLDSKWAREQTPQRALRLSNMIKNLSDVNDKLMDLNKKNKDMEEPLKKVEQQQNNIFLGSTSDLQKLLKEKDEKIVDAPSTELPRES